VTLSIEGLALATATVAVGSAIPRAPSLFARFAFLPLGPDTTLVVPPRAAAVLMSSDGAATYRSMGPAAVPLARIPGDAVVNGDGFRLHFFPDRGYVVASVTKNLSPFLVRVDVRPAEGSLVLRARQLSGSLPFIPALLLVWVLRWTDPLYIVGLGVLVLVGFVRELVDAKRSVAPVVAELKQRLDALAADAPLPSPP
jgi:hypothetical protein